MPENPASYRVVRTKSYLFNKAFRDWMEKAAEQQHFEASLNCIPERLQEALDEAHS
ncbi:hypothetical protein GPL39_23435 (plasmid) [Escherichia coli]|nr:hypothetical protein GPL39_23435 [Escherichia coli]